MKIVRWSKVSIGPDELRKAALLVYKGEYPKLVLEFANGGESLAITFYNNFEEVAKTIGKLLAAWSTADKDTDFYGVINTVDVKHEPTPDWNLQEKYDELLVHAKNLTTQIDELTKQVNDLTIRLYEIKAAHNRLEEKNIIATRVKKLDDKIIKDLAEQIKGLTIEYNIIQKSYNTLLAKFKET